jgi:hypothetical protein
LLQLRVLRLQLSQGNRAATDRHQLAPTGVAAANDRLLTAAGTLLPQPHAWWLLADRQDYLWRHIASHLAGCGRLTELVDLRWIEAKLRRFDPIVSLTVGS